MNEESKTILKIIGIEFNEIDDLNGLSILRDQLLSDNKYEDVKKLLPELKKIYSSSLMTSLQRNADKSQKWPLLHLWTFKTAQNIPTLFYLFYLFYLLYNFIQINRILLISIV